jgi:methenyltetrahydrofolate cyclohydrolase
VLSDLPLVALLEELAAPRAAPGGGSALAVALASAAAIVEMGARISAESWPDAAGVAVQAGVLRERATALVQADADAYRRALESRAEAARLPPSRRDFELGRAFAAAAEPPLELARIAADVADLARLVGANGDPRVHPDAEAAVELAAAAARGARALVEVNLTALPGDERLAEADRLAAAAAGERH